MRFIKARFFPRRGSLASLLVLVLLLPLNSGCGVFRAPVPPGFDKVEIASEVDRDKKGRAEGDLVAYSTTKGVLVGAALGGPSGALSVGATGLAISLAVCAPIAVPFLFFAPVVYVACAGIATAASVAGGFVVGLGTGITIGVVGGLPSKTAKEVTTVLKHVEDGRSFEEDIMAAMQDAIPPAKQTEGADAEAVVTARLDGLELNQHSKDRLSITVEASMEQVWQGDDATSKKKTCKYSYDTDKKPVKTWLASDGVAFRESITQGIGVVGRWMNRDLEAFASESEFAKTKDTPRSCFRRTHWYDVLLPF